MTEIVQCYTKIKQIFIRENYVINFKRFNKQKMKNNRMLSVMKIDAQFILAPNYIFFFYMQITAANT